MKINKTIIPVMLIILTTQTALSDEVSQYPIPTKLYTHQNHQVKINNTEEGKIFVPVDTVITIKSGQSLKLSETKTGDKLNCYLPSDLYYNNNLIAPEGSKVTGTVLSKKKGELYITFNNIKTPYGQTIPITAKVKTSDKTGIIKTNDSMIKEVKGSIQIEANTIFDIILNQPITIYANTPF